MASLIEEIVVGTTTLKVKFLRTLKVSSITNPKFLLRKNLATPVSVTNPFQPIAVSNDYEGVSRTLTLYYTTNLEPSTSYRLTVTGLQDAAGASISDEFVDFTTQAVTTPGATDPIPPADPEPLQIEDHSIKSIAFDELTTAANPDFFIVATDPPVQEPMVSTGYASGRVTVKFNAFPQPSFINTNYFKVQRKKIQRSFSRWDPVGVQVSADSNRPWVYVDFPSTDSTPVYDTPGREYFPVDWKFRLRVSSDVASTAGTGQGGQNRLDLIIEQGATFNRSVTYLQANGTPYDITGYSARMQIRSTYGGTLLLDLTTANGRLVIDGPAGRITISIDAVTTASLVAGEGVYDLEVVSPAATPVVTRLLEGAVTVTSEVTQ
jgi:hypothetical protein